METRKKSSIFDLLEGYMERMTEEMKRVPLPVEEMLTRLEEEMPDALRDFVTEEETPEGKARIYGPFIYGLSYTKEPGKEPEIKEFGNIKPSHERIAPALKCECEPLIDVIDYKNTYEVVVELPDVEKSDIKLDVTEESLDIKTGDGQRFSKEIPFDMPVTPATAKATYKNGVLCVAIKKEKGEKKKTAISLE